MALVLSRHAERRSSQERDVLPATLCPSLGALVVPQTVVSAEFPALPGTVAMNWWGLQGEKEEEREGWLRKEQPGPWRTSISLCCADCGRRERKATGAVGGEEEMVCL